MSNNDTTRDAALVEVRVPDIGDFKDIPVIELAVKAGDTVAAEDTLITLESDKATMDVPTPVGGVIAELKVKVGDTVSQGTLVALLKVGAGETASATAPVAAATTPPTAASPASAPESAPASASPAPAAASAALAAAPASASPAAPLAAVPPAPAAAAPAGALPMALPELVAPPPRMHMPTPAEMLGGNAAHASPSVRRFARELGVDVARVSGSGPKGRITQEDVQAYVKAALSGAAGGMTGAALAPAPTSGGGLDVLPWPKVDFAKFGPVETKPLSRIKKISGANLHRNWVMIPHVTQFDEADITALEAFRVSMNKELEKGAAAGGAKLTMLAFLIKASVAALKKFPEFNASLDGDTLVVKQYYHIGFAADTPNGLVVPVLRDADKKGVVDIAQEMGELAKKARDGKLGPAEMQGGCFSISSLGGIGGTAFTPIINAPEVAILGVSKTQTKPVWDAASGSFAPRQMLPLSLSYDHRVIDGAAAARFTSYLAALLADMRRIML